MATVKSIYFAGKTVNAPHLEHRRGNDKNTVTFDANGYAECSPTMAKSLLEFFPRQVEVVENRPPDPVEIRRAQKAAAQKE